LIKSLASPAAATGFKFEEIVSLVERHFHPKRSAIVERFNFNGRRQNESESVAAYVAELRKIAEFCEFGDTLMDMLRDRLVCGIRDKNIQRRLLAEPKLTFNRAMEMTQAAETAERDAKRLQIASANEGVASPNSEHYNRTEVHKIQQEGKQNTQSSAPSQHEKPTGRNFITCTRCGGKHSAAKCYYKDSDCHYCGKKGHIASACRTRLARKRKPEQAHVVTSNRETTVQGSKQAEHEGTYSLYHMQDRTGKEPLHIKLDVNNKEITMEVDTGASVSLLSEETFHTLWKGEAAPKLQKSSVTLKTYTGEQIKVVGSAEVQVEHNEQVVRLSLLVIQGQGPSLLGRDWMASLRLDWKEIFEVNGSLPRYM
jgi:hypothetical protein